MINGVVAKVLGYVVVRILSGVAAKGVDKVYSNVVVKMLGDVVARILSDVISKGLGDVHGIKGAR